MKKIYIVAGFYVDIDSLNHTLMRESEWIFSTKKGVTENIKHDQVLGYFPNMDQCLNRVMKLLMAESEERNLDFSNYLGELVFYKSGLTAIGEYFKEVN